MRMSFRASLPLVLALVYAPTTTALAQPPTLTTAAPITYDFTGYTAAGLGNPAMAGQLDTRAFQVILIGTSQCLFNTPSGCSTGAFALGSSPGGVTSGGLYTFTSVPSAPDFGFQPSGSAFTGSTGGSFWLAIVNGTGATLANLTVTANVWVFNDQTRDTIVRAMVRNGTASGAGSVALGMVTSPAAPSTTPAWVSTPIGGMVDVSSLAIASGATFYVEFTMADGPATSGSRDELALDDIVISAMPSTCGNGMMDTGETCDTGALNGTTPCGCTRACALAAMGTTCAPSGGMPCDAPDTCDGAGACVPRIAAAGVSCRASTGLCDPAETCDGTALTCPTDVISPSTTTCRPAIAGGCDVADTCNGTTGACPDVLAPNGTSCDDTIACNGADSCMAGACVHAGAPDCSDTNACTTDSCVEAAVMCMHVPVANCCTDATDCDDHDACTTNGCTHAGGVCTYDPIADCCSTNADCDDGNACTSDTCETTSHHCAHANSCIDAGSDAGSAPHDAGAGDASRTDASATDAGHLTVPRSSGCACTTAGGSRHEGWSVLALIALRLVARRRPRASAAVVRKAGPTQLRRPGVPGPAAEISSR